MTPAQGRRRGLAPAVVLALVVGIGTAVVVGSRSLAQGPAVPRFVDETATSGLVHTFDGGSTASTGGGLAVLDCDADGRPDLYVAGGDRPAALFRNDSPSGGPVHFTRVPTPVLDRPRVTGAYPLDLDGDGQTDLAVLGAGETQLVRGLGACAFEDAAQPLGFDAGGAWTTAFSAIWEGANRLPTLAVGSYLELGDDGEPADTYDCAANALVRPATATARRYGPPIPLTPGFCTLSMLFSDWSGTGRRDLRISNDRQYYIGGSEQLWRVAPGEAPRLFTEADGWRTLRIFGMGIASQDLDLDGHPEVYLTSQADNKLQTLASGASQPAYEDIAQAAGVLATQPYTGGDRLPSTAWHPEFGDVNDDGALDLFVSKGNVDAMPDYAAKDPSNLFLGRGGASFAEAGDRAGIVTFARGRGAALVDLDLDGLLDLVQVNLGAPTMVWRNLGGSGTGPATAAPMGHWLAVRVRQPGPNRDAIGGWLEVRGGPDEPVVLRQELTVGGGHIGGQLGWRHIGLGSRTSAQLRVVWPDGDAGPWLKMAADGFGVLDRSSGAITAWMPGTPLP